MGTECQVWRFGYPDAMRGKEGTKNRLGLTSKLRFITDTFPPKFHRLFRIGWECHVWTFGYPAAVRGELQTKNCFVHTSKVPFIADPFRPNLQFL
jgi:hypothetical protein